MFFIKKVFRVSTLKIWNMPILIKKSIGAFSAFLWTIKKLGHLFCYNKNPCKVLKIHFVKIWLYLKNQEKC